MNDRLHMQMKARRELMKRLEALASDPHGDLLNGLLDTVCRFFEGGADRRDLKLAHVALRESRMALEVFSAYRHVPKISVFGSARMQPGDPAYQMAEEFCRQIVRHGFMVLTGAGGGIMEAANKGAGREKSFGLNIELPFEQTANEFIAGDPKLVDFRFFFTRKLFFIKETNAMALFPGGFGTLDEGYEALTLIQTGKSTPKPIVLLETESSTYWEEWREYVTGHLLARDLIHENDLTLFRICTTVEDAVDEITRFFRVFHSAYRTREGVAIWLWRKLEEAELELLNDTFSKMMGGRTITQLSIPHRQLSDTEPDDLSCLDVPMDHRQQGRLRQFIDALNSL